MYPSDHSALVEFEQKASRLQRAVNFAGSSQCTKTSPGRDGRDNLETPSLPHKLQDDAAALEKRTNEILRALRGDTAAIQRNMNTPPSINERVGYIVAAQRTSTSRSTQTQVNHTRLLHRVLKSCSASCINYSMSIWRGLKTVGSGRCAVDAGPDSRVERSNKDKVQADRE